MGYIEVQKKPVCVYVCVGDLLAPAFTNARWEVDDSRTGCLGGMPDSL